ncbi:MAG: hypothetical protein FRX48_02667 [Lasallia pustulata]|uniref:DUF3431 domain containing protein n=1 Tax=Lasallia pustulata TaxID=136370 RepID=A0A5M8PZ54_9LECA|nr:MAG: hypothetical protein FRX48_02667 [Lasallia pustulata]
MRTAHRLLIAAVLVLAFLILVKVRLYEIWDQNNVPAYIRSSLGFSLGFDDDDDPFSHPPLRTVSDKVIVIAKMEREDTDWVAENLPDWQHAIYTVDNPNATLHTPANKGHESMAYLTYIIEHYDALPTIMALIHPRRNGFWAAWHTDTPLHDNVDSLRKLRTDFVRRNGYANLRCNWNPGCKLEQRNNAHVTPQIWRELFAGTEAPGEIGATCCAQFAVSRERVLRRGRGEYERYRRWVLDTELEDRASGRVMEYLWHVIFGMETVYCPDEYTCYCDVYGQC